MEVVFVTIFQLCLGGCCLDWPITRPSKAPDHTSPFSISHPETSSCIIYLYHAVALMAADPLGIASAIVGLAGFAGQTLNSVRYLCDFFTAVRDALDDIKNIAQEL
jgi:hypothetical protein